MNAVSIRADEASRDGAYSVNGVGVGMIGPGVDDRGVDVMGMGDPQDDTNNNHGSAVHQAIQGLVQVTSPLFVPPLLTPS